MIIVAVMMPWKNGATYSNVFCDLCNKLRNTELFLSLVVMLSNERIECSHDVVVHVLYRDSGRFRKFINREKIPAENPILIDENL